MSAIRTGIHRKMRIAFSRHAQPIWFRITKWTFILVSVVLFHDRHQSCHWLEC